MAQLRRETSRIHAFGAELVVIGNGTEHFAQAFREDLDLQTPLYVDPTRASYRALGMARGVARTLGSWRIWRQHLRELGSGMAQRRLGRILRWWFNAAPTLRAGTQGDAWQLGGVLVVLPGGRVAYQYRSRIAGDHPPPSEILAALKAQALTGSA